MIRRQNYQNGSNSRAPEGKNESLIVSEIEDLSEVVMALLRLKGLPVLSIEAANPINIAQEGRG